MSLGILIFIMIPAFAALSAFEIRRRIGAYDDVAKWQPVQHAYAVLGGMFLLPLFVQLLVYHASQKNGHPYFLFSLPFIVLSICGFPVLLVIALRYAGPRLGGVLIGGGILAILYNLLIGLGILGGASV